MNRRKKTVLVVLGIIVVVAVAGTVAVKGYFSAREKKAVQLAQDYLAEKYKQEMNYESVRYSWVDPAIYLVTFSPANNPELSFEVYVQNNLTILPEGTKEFGRYYSSPDNYYFAYFYWEMKNRFQDDVKQIWSEDTSFMVLAMNQGLYGFSIPAALNDQLSLDEMAGLIDEYYFYVKTNQIIDENTKQNEAPKILDFIQIIRESRYKPNRLVLYYNTSNSSKGTAERINISFDNWSEIITVDQVIENINTQLRQ